MRRSGSWRGRCLRFRGGEDLEIWNLYRRKYPFSTKNEMKGKKTPPTPFTKRQSPTNLQLQNSNPPLHHYTTTAHGHHLNNPALTTTPPKLQPISLSITNPLNPYNHSLNNRPRSRNLLVISKPIIAKHNIEFPFIFNIRRGVSQWE